MRTKRPTPYSPPEPTHNRSRLLLGQWRSRPLPGTCHGERCVGVTGRNGPRRGAARYVTRPKGQRAWDPSEGKGSAFPGKEKKNSLLGGLFPVLLVVAMIFRLPQLLLMVLARPACCLYPSIRSKTTIGRCEPCQESPIHDLTDK